MKRALLLGTILAALSWPAFATVLYTLDTSNNVGNSGPGPYETLDVTLTDSTHAMFVATAYPNFSFGDFAVNVNALSFTGTFVSDIALAGDSVQPAYSIGSGSIGAGLGNFSLIENDTASNGFSSSVTQLTFTVENLGGVWANETEVLVGNNNAPPEFAAAHTFNIALNGASFFSSDSTPPVTCTANDCLPGQHTSTPEPMSIAVLGMGLIGLGVARRRRSK